MGFRARACGAPHARSGLFHRPGAILRQFRRAADSRRTARSASSCPGSLARLPSAQSSVNPDRFGNCRRHPRRRLYRRRQLLRSSRLSELRESIRSSHHGSRRVGWSAEPRHRESLPGAICAATRSHRARTLMGRRHRVTRPALALLAHAAALRSANVHTVCPRTSRRCSARRSSSSRRLCPAPGLDCSP